MLFRHEIAQFVLPTTDNRQLIHPAFPVCHGEVIMSKGMDRKKDTKKKPLKTPEEKRAEKRSKKAPADIV